MSGRAFAWLLCILTPVYCMLAAVLPPADDELYYWCWSERLQLSYYDHPPLTAYMIRAATAVLGNHLLAIRVPAILASLTVLGVIGWLTRPRDLLPFVVFTPLFTFAAVFVTPDTPLLMFWALYLLWLVKVHEQMQSANRQTSLWHWLLGGLILGCGILGKYTTGLAVIGGCLSFAFAGNWRKWVLGYAVHLLVAFVVTLPILIHNLRRDFAPLAYQWQHAMSSSEPGLKALGEFIGVQLLLFGALPLGMLAWVVWRWRDLRPEPRLRVCACLFAFPFAFFLYKATRGRLEGNWALACYIAVWPLAAAWYETVKSSARWRRLAKATFVLPAAAVIFPLIHVAWPIPLVPPRQDVITRQVSKLAVARELAATLARQGEIGPVFAPNYQWVSLLRFHHIDARQIDGFSRPSHFTQTPERPADRDRAYVFAEGFLPEQFARGFGPARILAHYPLVVRGESITFYWLMEYVKPSDATRQPPRTARALD